MIVDHCPQCHEPLAPGATTCPACGADLDAFPTWEGQRVSHDWTAPVPPSPATRDDAFVPLAAPPAAESSPARLVGLALAVVVTAALLVLWRIAEMKIVDDDPWEHWDLVWFGAAGASIVALTLWGVAIVRYLRQRP